MSGYHYEALSEIKVGHRVRVDAPAHPMHNREGKVTHVNASRVDVGFLDNDEHLTIWGLCFASWLIHLDATIQPWVKVGDHVDFFNALTNSWQQGQVVSVVKATYVESDYCHSTVVIGIRTDNGSYCAEFRDESEVRVRVRAPADAPAPPSHNFAIGDHVRLKAESRQYRYAESEPEIMVVASIDGDVIEMMHEIQPGMRAPWGVEHLVHVESNCLCVRCGWGAHQGLFSVSCNRPGGCKTVEERVGEPRIGTVDSPDIVSVRGCSYGGEPGWIVRGRPDRRYATRELAVAAWKAVRREGLEEADRIGMRALAHRKASR